MTEAKFTWFPKLTATVAKVPEEQRGAILWALAQYGTYGVEPVLEWPLDAIFESLREDIDNSKRAISSGGTGGRGTKKGASSERRNAPFRVSKPRLRSRRNGGFGNRKRWFDRCRTQTKPYQAKPSQPKEEVRPALR